MTVENAVSVVLLGTFIWVVAFLLPRARREHDRFGVICSLLAAVVALIGWLLIGIGARSVTGTNPWLGRALGGA